MCALVFSCLFASAALYVGALLLPDYAWWGSLCFCTPFYYLSLYHSPRFTHGFWWGIGVFGTMFYHLFYSPETGLAFVTPQTADLAPLMALGIIGLTIYFSLYSGIWFWLTNYLLKKSPTLTLPVTLHMSIIWLITTPLYIFWIDRYSLWPFLRTEGFPLMHPLIPLTTHPTLLVLLPIIGKNLLTVLLLIPSALIISLGRAAWTIQNRLLYASLCIGIIACLIMAKGTHHTCYDHTDTRPPWLTNVIWLPFQGTGTFTLATIAQQTFKQILHTHPDTQLIILPESAFYTDALCDNNKCTTLWNETELAHPITIISGSFSKIPTLSYNQIDNMRVHNTCYLIHNGVTLQQFHKKHTMHFVEQIPSWAQHTLFFNLFFADLPPITPSRNERTPFIIPGIPPLVPYLCSELFFTENPDDNYEHIPILALINDSWTSHHCINQLLFRLAQLKALQWQRPILYISYTYGHYIDTQGMHYSVTTQERKDC